MARLRDAVDEARRDLSFVDETEVKIPFIAMGNDGTPLNLIQKITQPKFKYLVNPIVEQCGESIDQAVRDADLTIDEIDKVILLCETKEIPILQDYLERHIGMSVEKGIDASECMAIGASISGAMFSADPLRGVIIDFWTPLSLGVVVGDSTKVMIEKLSPIPVEHTEIFTTVQDNQTELSFELFLGENRNPNLNKKLGSFVLYGIQPAPKGVPQIEVTFEVDVDGILNVTATDLATGSTKSITITSPYDITQEEIDEAIETAKAIEAADSQIQLAQRLIYSDDIKNLNVQTIEFIQSLISELMELKTSGELISIKNKTNELHDAVEMVNI